MKRKTKFTKQNVQTQTPTKSFSLSKRSRDTLLDLRERARTDKNRTPLILAKKSGKVLNGNDLTKK